MSKGSHAPEPANSIQRQILDDPVLAKKYRDNEAKFNGDAKAFEKWAREGYTSSPEGYHDIEGG